MIHRKPTIVWLLILGMLLPAPSTWAASGTEGAAFLDIPVGAAPAALGGAYTAQAEDAYATVWNPAGLGFLASTQIAGQHLSYLDSIQYEFLSFVHPFTEKGGIGVSAQYLGSGSIPQTDRDANILGDFSSYYGSFNAGYGLNITDKLALGAVAKLIHAKIMSTTASAYAVDAGALYHASDKLSLGGTVTNVGTKLKFVDQADPLPLAVHLGATYWPTERWATSAEVVYLKEGPASLHTGIEWMPLDILSLRGGYRTDTLKELSAMAGLTLGVGLHLWEQEFSYAWLPMGELGMTHYFSLVLRFWDLDIKHPRRNFIHYRPFDSLVLKGRDTQGTHLAGLPDQSNDLDPVVLFPTDKDENVAKGGAK